MSSSLKKQTDSTEAPQKKKRGSKKRVIAIVVVAAIVVAGGWYFIKGNNQAVSAADLTYTLADVERRDITSQITGSGSLEAANSYSVSTLLEGTILSANFEEGDIVEEGTVLYTIDSSDASSSLEKAQISVAQAQRSYSNKVSDLDDLKVESTLSGRVLEFDLEVGDEISVGQTIATIQDYETMKLTVPFPADDAASFYIGQSATVTMDSSFETLSGSVSEIAVNDTVLSGNIIVRSVTINVSNPGGISTSQAASATINGVNSASGGTFAYKDEGVVTATASGTIAKINIAKGDWVNKNQVLLTLSSDTLSDEIQSASESVRNAQLSLESQQDQLDDYTITSPISGTIIDKNYKAGETTESNQVLCTIYDLTYLTMTLSVDELDVSNIAVGQTVSIVADAVSDKTYEGVVTKVSVAGSVSSGVTTYPVTIRIDETEGLLPGMNVDATITLESANDVLAIPSSALTRGNRVQITADSPSAVNAVDTQAAAMPNMADMAGEADAAGEAAQQDAASAAQTDVSTYVTVEVTVGVSDDNYTEIISGLQEGDVVAYIPTTSSSSNMTVTGMPGGGTMIVTNDSGGGGMSGGPGMGG